MKSLWKVNQVNQIQNNSSGSIQSAFLESGTVQSITLGQLQLSPFKVERVLDAKMKHEINKHSTLFVKAMLPEGTEACDIESISEGKNVSLLTGEQIIFQGLIQEIEVFMLDHVYYVEIHAVSYTFLLDSQIKSCSFQNRQKTYHDLINQVTRKYPNAGVIDAVTNGRVTNQVIVQYRETSWQLLVRLASHFNTGLFCDSRFDSPKYFFGLPERPTISLESFNYRVRKDLRRFKLLKDNGVSGLDENHFIFYEVRTNQTIQLGDQVRFKGRVFHVGAVSSEIEGDILMNCCTLTTRQGLSQPYLPHDEIIGCALGGRVIDVENDRVKAHLDIDEHQSVADATFFPFSTPYSSGDGSGFYAMSQIGDKIRLQFPDDNDDHAYAISATHEPSTPPSNQQSASQGNASSGSASSPPPPPSGAARDNPDIKSLRHPSGREITLTEDGIFITDLSGYITMTEEGVRIYSEKDIELKSDKDITMSAEEEVQIIAEEVIEISAGDTAKIKLEEDIELQGQEVRSN